MATSTPVPFELICIIGCTGVGKSRLAIELAERLHGEVVSADSMQLYVGCDVATAKVTAEEQARVRHHLLDILPPTCTDFNAQRFVELAVPLIAELRARNVLPVVVGGTHQYVEALLCENIMAYDGTAAPALAPEELVARLRAAGHMPNDSQLGGVVSGTALSAAAAAAAAASPVTAADAAASEPLPTSAMAPTTALAEPFLSSTMIAELYTALESVDPTMAARLHPHDQRKVRRSLEVFLFAGRRHSDLLQQQSRRSRYPHACIINVTTADHSVHDARLDARVDQMFAAGLVDEVARLAHSFHTAGAPLVYDKGILQSIGYRQMQPVLELCYRADALTRPPPADALVALLPECTERIKLATRKYARKQLAWLASHFVPFFPIFSVDTTDVSVWDERVLQPCLDMFAAGWTEETATVLTGAPNDDAHSRHMCDVCQRIIIGTKQFQQHLKSRTHRLLVKRQRKGGSREETHARKRDTPAQERKTE